MTLKEREKTYQFECITSNFAVESKNSQLRAASFLTDDEELCPTLVADKV